MRVLIDEDNPKLAEYIKIGAGKQGFSLDWVATAGDADTALATVPYEAIILDLGLPDMDGSEWLNRFRERGDTRPVLVLTARDSAKEVARNLDIGADDYLRKPFEMTELIARLRALARRPGHMLSALIKEGNLVLDCSLRELSVADHVVPLGRREIDGLEVLLRRAGRVVTKGALEEAIYGNDEEVSANAIEVLIHRLRKRLIEADASLTIHTLRGVGYVLSQRQE